MLKVQLIDNQRYYIHKMARFFALVAIFVTPFGVLASEKTEHEDKKSFNAGEVIMHHIMDAHEIHLMTFGEGTSNEKHITIPLPIIIYDKEAGKLEMFSSSKFHHGHSAHNGYVLHHEKIYKANASGELDLDEEGHPTNYKPLDFSITKTVAGIFLSVILLVLIFGSVAKAYKKRGNAAPKGLQSLMEPLILFVRDEIAKPSIGKRHEKYVPFLLTIFFFIWIANLLGLIPFIGGFNVTGNIAVALVLAVFTFMITVFSGNKDYWIHIFNTPGVPWWLKFPIPLMLIIELIGFISKPVVLTLRLFANITAGHIIILAFISLIFIFANIFSSGAGFAVSALSVVFSIFMFTIELLVAFLQAYVFTLLSALYFGSAVEEHHETH